MRMSRGQGSSTLSQAGMRYQPSAVLVLQVHKNYHSMDTQAASPSCTRGMGGVCKG